MATTLHGAYCRPVWLSWVFLEVQVRVSVVVTPSLVALSVSAVLLGCSQLYTTSLGAFDVAELLMWAACLLERMGLLHMPAPVGDSRPDPDMNTAYVRRCAPRRPNVMSFFAVTSTSLRRQGLSCSGVARSVDRRCVGTRMDG